MDEIPEMLPNVHIIPAEETQAIDASRFMGPAKTLSGSECRVELAQGATRAVMISIDGQEADGYMEYMAALFANFGADLKVAWRYMDGSPRLDSEAIQQDATLPAGMMQYVISVTDAEGQPLSGTTIRICDASTCQIVVTDGTGSVTHTATAYPYEIHVLKAPEGYARTTEAYVFPQEGGEMTIVLEKADN